MDVQTRKRGRPRLLERDVGLNIAASLFWERGYEGTSIADLTQAMGIAPPSLYAAFGSKQDLYRQAIDYILERDTHCQTEALQSEMSAYNAIAFVLEKVAHGATVPDKPRGCIVATALLQHAEDNERVAQFVATKREDLIQSIKERFVRAVGERELPTDVDADLLARFYFAVIQGMAAQACDGACTDTVRGLAKIALSAWPGVRGD